MFCACREETYCDNVYMIHSHLSDFKRSTYLLHTFLSDIINLLKMVTWQSCVSNKILNGIPSHPTSHILSSNFFDCDFHPQG